MKLPLDNFQLLGASVGMEAHSILSILEKRLEKSTYSGFSHQTLSKRKEILLESSRVLLEPNRRKEYEKLVTKVDPDYNKNEIEVRQGSQIAGLLLLLENGQTEECLSLAYSEYQRWKTRVGDLGTSYQDLLLIIDYATLDHAMCLKDKRFFENSASVIEKRLLDEEKGFSSTELKIRMEDELEKLMPYRILDLISRESNDTSHKCGLEKLRYLIRERGGIEKESNRYMGNEEFKAFFRQIRIYLTVQEQIDLFEDWANSGSKVGAFLKGIALVASGFVQRKPEKLLEALKTLERIRSDELEPMIANIYLLLGDVKSAEALFELYADKELKDWTQNYSDDKLGGICAWCREWLSRDVLSGYRDIEAEANLEAYFGDRDVIDYLEIIEKASKVGSHEINSRDEKRISTNLINREAGSSLSGGQSGDVTAIRIDKRRLTWSEMRSKLKNIIKAGGLITPMLIVTFAAGLLLISSKWKGEKQEKALQSKQKDMRIVNTNRRRENSFSDMSSIYKVLTRYLLIKGDVLAGDSLPKDATDYLSDNAIKSLLYEREVDRRKAEKQVIDVKIKELSIKERGESSITVKAILYYKDKRVNNEGGVISETPKHEFGRMYTLINKANRWLVN